MTTYIGSGALVAVAAPRVAAGTTFISADDRQLAVAKATGLAVVNIKRRVPRAKR